VPIPLPIRRRSPSRRRYRETEYEEIDYRDAEPDADYRDIWIKRERSTHRKAPKSEAPKSVRSESVKSKSSSSSFEEVSKEPSPVREVGKKGRTRMPKRLVHKKAVVQLGYPFEEEVSRLAQSDRSVSDDEQDDFIVIKRALQKEHIDEIIKISEDYKESELTSILSLRLPH